MFRDLTKWLLFLLLCTVWGSSFILMKLGLYGNGNLPLLSPYQVAALRIFSASLVLLFFFVRAVKRIPRNAWGYIFLSGLLGNFLPAFLFCIAETRISSALTAMLNTLTPICALLAGVIIYHVPARFNQWLGVITGLAGCIILFGAADGLFSGDLSFTALVLLATVCYGLNVNMVRHKLSRIASLDIAAAAFAVFLLPSAAVLLLSGFFRLPLSNKPYLIAVSATAVLGIAGTALATIAFYKVVKLAGPVFASMVTYGIPFIAITWGIIYGETITAPEVTGLVIILAGVYIASRTKAAAPLKEAESA